MASVSPDMISRVERASRVPGLVVLRRIASALHVDPAQLLDEASTEETPDSGRLPDGTRELAVPIYGRIAAGRPNLAQQQIEGWVTVSAVRSGVRLFALRVSGDSMLGAGICDGDLVIVRAQSAARDGQIVVALLDEEATVKRFHRAGDRVLLQAENPQFSSVLLPADRVRVQGVVIEVRRALG